jgi:hypothetical protein
MFWVNPAPKGLLSGQSLLAQRVCTRSKPFVGVPHRPCISYGPLFFDPRPEEAPRPERTPEGGPFGAYFTWATRWPLKCENGPKGSSRWANPFISHSHPIPSPSGDLNGNGPKGSSRWANPFISHSHPIPSPSGDLNGNGPKGSSRWANPFKGVRVGTPEGGPYPKFLCCLGPLSFFLVCPERSPLLAPKGDLSGQGQSFFFTFYGSSTYWSFFFGSNSFFFWPSFT